MKGSKGTEDLAFVVHAGSSPSGCYLVNLTMIAVGRQIECRDMEMHRSFHFFAIPPACITEMILELLHQDIDFAFRGSSPALQDETIHGHAEDDAGEKPDHQPIGEHLIGHALHLLLPECPLAALNLEDIPIYPKAHMGVKHSPARRRAIAVSAHANRRPAFSVAFG